ncbi:phosphoribosylaminoimidazole-succinocarboxamide synthase [Bacilli bacterium PM5-3]|nr:phosphoribosylaminoimidazole-succinocarboxamide synthase [Bacilli bacterium PM5-3]MDH6603284.1 phosphoribosylaminoimidazole-succinocarboxamide synthase [Bacilli bacterium PM5-9]
MEKENIIYEGKAKYILETANPNEIIVKYKDDATAFNGVKKAKIENKGILNNKITVIIYNYLMENKIDTHLIKMADERSQLCKKVTIFPIEFICRNVVAGAMAKRLGLEEGMKLSEPVLEISYKNDRLNDPLLNDAHAYALKIINKEQLEYCYNQVLKINELLIDLFNRMDITLIDFKVEFGLDKDGKILLADEFSPDNCRLWETKTGRKLDKDVFRRDLGDITDTYQLVLSKLEALNL